jgi:hypothetical protein
MKSFNIPNIDLSNYEEKIAFRDIYTEGRFTFKFQQSTIIQHVNLDKRVSWKTKKLNINFEV